MYALPYPGGCPSMHTRCVHSGAQSACQPHRAVEESAQSARLALGAQAPTTTKFEAIVKAWSRAMAERPDEPLPGESAGQGRSTRAAAESTESTVDDTTLLLRRACVGGRTFWAFRTIHAARLPPSAAADNRPDLTQHFSTE